MVKKPTNKTIYLNRAENEWASKQGPGFIRGLVKEAMTGGLHGLSQRGGDQMGEGTEEGLRARTGPEGDDLAEALSRLLGPGVAFTVSGTTKHVAARSPEGRGRTHPVRLDDGKRVPKLRRKVSHKGEGEVSGVRVAPVQRPIEDLIDPVTGEVL